MAQEWNGGVEVASPGVDRPGHVADVAQVGVRDLVDFQVTLPGGGGGGGGCNGNWALDRANMARSTNTSTPGMLVPSTTTTTPLTINFRAVCVLLGCLHARLTL